MISEKELVLIKMGSLEPDFRKGFPSVEEVLKHQQEYPIPNDYRPVYLRANPKHIGANWISMDEFGRLQHLTLRIGAPGEKFFSGNEKINVNGKILVENGNSFWQLFEQCGWASKHSFTPVDQKGVPVRWKVV
jgi:hypothetical protein